MTIHNFKFLKRNPYFPSKLEHISFEKFKTNFAAINDINTDTKLQSNTHTFSDKYAK